MKVPGCKASRGSCLREHHWQHTSDQEVNTEPAIHPSGCGGAQAVRLAHRSRSFENRPGLTAPASNLPEVPLWIPPSSYGCPGGVAQPRSYQKSQFLWIPPNSYGCRGGVAQPRSYWKSQFLWIPPSSYGWLAAGWLAGECVGSHVWGEEQPAPLRGR